ncbi:MAG: hypothetical protein DHS20C15_04510 [Planctomycetota bacterium]|nr:MAG: hypothetical protein DHS20C15_04510 [Planctomycetota bacterium]
MLISTLMTRAPMFVSPKTSLHDAFELMTSEDIRHLPVLEHGALRGVISDRDLLESLGAPGHETSSPGASSQVCDVMACQPATLSPQDTVVSAAVEFLVNRIGCLPVLEGAELVGMLTEMDMLAAAARQLEPADGPPTQPVEALMAKVVHTAAPDTTLTEAFALMRRHRVRHLPVVDEDQLVGLLSDRDLRAAIGSEQPDDLPIASVMSREPLTVGPELGLPEAARLMAVAKVSCLPVVRGAALLGLLSLTDVLEHCLESLRDMPAS